MAETKREPGNFLPHNPLKVSGVLEELKKLRGEKPWIQFELELLCKQYPSNTIFKTALERINAKANPSTTPPGPKVTAASKKEVK
jgi:hypothetical protein